MRILIVTAAIAFLTLPAAAQSWQEYRYPDDGFGASFPAQPQMEQAQYKAPDGISHSERIYFVTQGGSDYRVMVADFSNADVDGDTIIAQAADLMRAQGNVLVDIRARVNREYGRQLSITDRKGRRIIAAIFFVDHRLVQIQGSVSSGDANTADAVRFQQSLTFTGGGFGFGFGRGRGRF